MSRRTYTVTYRCAEDGCTASAFSEASNLRERAEITGRLAKDPWRCTRHRKPEDVLGAANPQREAVLVAGRYKELRELFWVDERGIAGSGLQHGPGFKAFANDFPEGTRLVITARIELPGGAE